jgi:hypothetical protein
VASTMNFTAASLAPWRDKRSKIRNPSLVQSTKISRIELYDASVRFAENLNSYQGLLIGRRAESKPVEGRA